MSCLQCAGNLPTFVAGAGTRGVDSGMVNRAASFVKPPSVDLAIPRKALKVRYRKSRALGRSSMPRVPWIWRNDALWDRMGKVHFASECASASLPRRASYSLRGYQDLLGVCLVAGWCWGW